MGRRPGKSMKNEVLGWIAAELSTKSAGKQRALFGYADAKVVKTARKKWQKRMVEHFKFKRRDNYLRLTVNRFIRDIANCGAKNFVDGEAELFKVYVAMLKKLKEEE